MRKRPFSSSLYMLFSGRFGHADLSTLGDSYCQEICNALFGLQGRSRPESRIRAFAPSSSPQPCFAQSLCVRMRATCVDSRLTSYLFILRRHDVRFGDFFSLAVTGSLCTTLALLRRSGRLPALPRFRGGTSWRRIKSPSGLRCFAGLVKINGIAEAFLRMAASHDP